MLVWKTQTLNIDVASLRYRCLFPLRYLTQLGISSVIYSGTDTIKFTADIQAIIFVKTFQSEDIKACEQAYQLGVPVILDLCDNIFIKDYAQDCKFVPSVNFLKMAQYATAIVTTGSAMKLAIEQAIADSNRPQTRSFAQALPVVIIPDGNESLSDIKYAFSATWQQRMVKKLLRAVAKIERLARRLRPLQKLKSLQKIRRRLQNKIKQSHRQIGPKSKTAFYQLKGKAGNVLRRYGLRKPLAVPPSIHPPVPVEQSVKKKEPTKVSLQSPCQAVTSSANRLSKLSDKSRPEPPPAWPQRWPQATEMKTVLWFGNYGAKHGNFGMLNILDVAAALETLSQECPLRLMVVSNNRGRYEQSIAPLPFNTHYLRWHPRKIYDYIRASDVVIVPNSQSVFSICKSANRTVLALSQGTPVVASYTPALDMLSECIWLDAWEAGLRDYLQHPEKGKSHVAIAQQIIAQHLSGETIARQWLSLLEEVAFSETAGSQVESKVLA